MTTPEVVGLTVLALMGWSLVFVPAREGIWRRTWLTAAVLVAAALVLLVREGSLGDAVGGVDGGVLASGLVVGVAWLVLTQIGHVVLCRVVPSFIDRVRDLYSIAVGDRRRDVLLAVLTMAVAEELVFRAVVQRELGLPAAVAAYTLVQLPARNWPLLLAAAAGGTVWGALYEWQDALVAPLIAHVVWTGALTFVWPLRGCGRDAIPEAAAVAVTDTPRT